MNACMQCWQMHVQWKNNLPFKSGLSHEAQDRRAQPDDHQSITMTITALFLLGTTSNRACPQRNQPTANHDANGCPKFRDQDHNQVGAMDVQRTSAVSTPEGAASLWISFIPCPSKQNEIFMAAYAYGIRCILFILEAISGRPRMNLCSINSNSNSFHLAGQVDKIQRWRNLSWLV